MKHNYSSSLRRALSAVVLLIVSTLSWAYSSKAGGIYYNINDDGTSVTVTSGPSNTPGYSGDIVIPSTVVNGDKTYSVTSIENGAFTGCYSLTSIDIPSSVTSIGENPFRHCSSLASVTVSVANPVYDSREGCNAIIETQTNTLVVGCKNTIIPSSVTSIGDLAFMGCYSLTSIDLPDGVTSIGTGAFDSCYSLTFIDLPEGVTSIGKGAFCSCSSLTSMDIPDGVTSIGGSTFHGCTSLTSVDIPSGVTSIGEAAFGGCSSLTTFICRAEKVPGCYDYSHPFHSVDKATLYVPFASINAYRAADGWKDFGTILPLEDYETGIDTPAAPQPDDASAAALYYTLGGQRVNAPVRGHIYIRSGRKVIY